MNDFEFIQEYKKMKSIKKICEKANIDYKNLMKNKTTKDKTSVVADICKVEVIKMYSKIMAGGSNGEKTNTL